MKILAVADVEAKSFYDYYTEGKLKEYDLIISAGDLPQEYLEFLVTMAGCPLFYVHGNHDDKYDQQPPEGCECIDDRLIVWNGIRILGLGGSYRYRNSTYMYTEKQMIFRIVRLFPAILFYKGFDILVTHAPVRGINDFDTLPHRGFECFRTLLLKFKPSLMIHGHIHRNYGVHIPQRTMFDHTEIINAFEYCRITYKEEKENL